MKKVLISLIIFAVFSHLNVYIANAQSINIDAQAYILFDSESGQPLCQRNADRRLFPASTTKIMTAILAIEKGDMDKMMAASASAVNDIGNGGMNIGIMAGEEISLENLLNALLIISASETANIIAENICSTRKEFIALMNERARELGAIDTNFTNPCGMHDPNHYSTAADMAKIARYAMTLPKFREIISKEYLDSMPVTNKHSTWNTLHATNKLLWYSRNYPYYVDGTKYEYIANGIKTGFTNEAGYNLISSAVDNNGMELISVIMGVREINDNKGIFTYSKELLKYGFENYKEQEIINKGIVIKKVSVANTRDKNSLDLITSDRVGAILPIDISSWSIEKREHLNLPTKAPVKKGDVLGSIEFFRDGVFLEKTNLIAARSVHESLFSQARRITKKAAGNQYLVNMFKIISIFLISLIILRVILRKISRTINAKKR